MKYATTLAVLLMVVSAVSATLTPTLGFTQTDLGGGLFAYDFFIDCDDAKLLSYATTLAFTADPGSTINQNLLFGMMDVNGEAMATTYDGQGVPPYVKLTDTWARSPFGETLIPGTSPRTNTVINGFVVGVNTFDFAVASGAGSAKGDNTPILHLVAGGGASGTYVGTIARDSVLYQVSGAYPEPATMALLSLGALGLIRRRR